MYSYCVTVVSLLGVIHVTTSAFTIQSITLVPILFVVLIVAVIKVLQLPAELKVPLIVFPTKLIPVGNVFAVNVILLFDPLDASNVNE